MSNKPRNTETAYRCIIDMADSPLDERQTAAGSRACSLPDMHDDPEAEPEYALCWIGWKILVRDSMMASVLLESTLQH
jgi:hypothetical protein